jgi:hypothetical protein
MAKSGLCGVVWTTARLRLAARGKKKKKKKKKKTFGYLSTIYLGWDDNSNRRRRRVGVTDDFWR